MIKILKFFTVLFSVIAVVSGCSTSKAIRTPVLDSPTVEQARHSGETGKLIRWGGRIVEVENESDYTLIEIVDRPLTRFGVPKITDKTGGRFLARADEFIEPENIKTGRYITVSGQLVAHQPGVIDQHEYNYPVVEINEYKVWPVNSTRYPRRYYDPYWYDPFWEPYPFWHHHYRLRYWHRHW